MICWYCYWGWPQQVVEVYRKWLVELGYGTLHFGPAHVVWEDENFETGIIQSCIDSAEEHRQDLTDEELNSVIGSLRELLLVPEAIRCCKPKGYNGLRPEDFPPPAGLVMVRER